jgi:sigma-B regulation protein RsbU (phosphoserine phosphatase)
VEASRRKIAEKNRQLEEDLLMAHEVQLAMMPAPQAPLEFGGLTLRLAHRYEPAGDMSGDFYAVLRISDHSVGLLVCDVMGHGVRSALITAMVRAMLEQLRPIASDPGALLTSLNRDLTRILRQAGGLIFVTAAYVVIDLRERRLAYSQAGHPTPLRCDGSGPAVRPISCPEDVAGPALGLIDDFAYATSHEGIGPNARVILYTDGVTEAAMASGEEFGEARLAESLSRSRHRPLGDALEGTVIDARRFAGDAFADDVCILGAELSATTPSH